MKQTFCWSFRRHVLAGMAALVAVALLAPGLARATSISSGYTITLVQQGDNVVATGSGSIDLTGLELGDAHSESALVLPAVGILFTGATGNADVYTGTFSGPMSFGTGSYGGYASNGNGDLAGIAAAGGQILVPHGYVSGNSLSSSATWDNATFASLGITPGTYVITWGTVAADPSIIIVAMETIATPEPATLVLFASGALCLLALCLIRRGWRIFRRGCDVCNPSV